MRTLRTLPIVLLACGLTGCGYVIETLVGQTVEDELPTTSPDGAGTVAKVVAEKLPPRTLVARDGDTCEVPRIRFRYIRVGQRIVCVWSEGSPQRSPMTTTPASPRPNVSGSYIISARGGGTTNVPGVVARAR